MGRILIQRRCGIEWPVRALATAADEQRTVPTAFATLTDVIKALPNQLQLLLQSIDSSES